MSHYLTNNLIVRGPLPKRINPLIRRPYAVLAHLSVRYPSLWGMFPRVTQPSAARQHSHSLLLISPFAKDAADFLRKIPASRPELREVNSESLLPLDLHVLGTPPAFILSQDQTLHKNDTYSVSDSNKLTMILHN